MTLSNLATANDGAAVCDTAGSRPLDLVHLSKYTLGDRGLEAELLGLFRAQAGVYVSRLETAATDKEWRDAAHSLKGSARGLGAWTLGDVAEEAEHLGDAAARGAMIARIRETIAVVNHFIDGLMA
jgi:HPt (histidine-containing phosphotransfer) domain-containing protein